MNRIKNLFFLFAALMFCNCAGTIITHRSNTSNKFKTALIISAKNSSFIKFRFGVITPFWILTLPDKAPVDREVIGNTESVIKRELERYGIEAQIGKLEEVNDDFDFILMYHDTWRWDFKRVLDKLEIVLISSDGQKELARSTYNIYKNKEIHNFPTPEKEVPKMIEELFSN